MPIPSSFETLREQFSQASGKWSNVESVVISWPEDQPEPSEENLPHELRLQGIRLVRQADINFACKALPFGRSLDTSQFRYRSGSANMLITRRRMLTYYGDPLEVSDLDDEQACYDRWKTLATVAAGKLDNLPSGTLSENTLGWRGQVRWVLAIHELLKPPRLPLESFYTYEVIRDVFLASALVLQIALPTTTEATDNDLSWQGRAVAMLLDHPRMLVKDIAKAVGVHPKTLSGYKKFTDARKVIKTTKANPDIPAGEVDPVTGKLEAYR